MPVLLLLAFLGFKIFGDRGPVEPTLNVSSIQHRAGNPIPDDPAAEDPPTPPEENLPPLDRANEPPEERDARAEEALRQFFAASAPKHLLPHVRHPKRVAAMISEYYQREPFETHDFLGLKSDLQEAEAIGPGFYAAEADIGGPRSHTMILEDTPTKGYKVDWEYHVQYNPMNWLTFIREVPTPPNADPMDFRVLARIVPDPRHPFTDEERYLAVQLLTLDDDTKELIGNVERESHLGKRLQEFLAGKAEELCILRLQFPAGAKPGDTAVYIRELVNPHWIITDEAAAD